MNTEERVKKILNGICGAEVTELSQRLYEDLMLDSLNMVMLLLEIEEEFSVQLDESDMNPFDLETVSDIVALAEKYCETSDAKSDILGDGEDVAAGGAQVCDEIGGNAGKTGKDCEPDCSDNSGNDKSVNLSGNAENPPDGAEKKLIVPEKAVETGDDKKIANTKQKKNTVRSESIGQAGKAESVGETDDAGKAENIKNKESKENTENTEVTENTESKENTENIEDTENTENTKNAADSENAEKKDKPEKTPEREDA